MTFKTDELRGLLDAESGLYSPSRWTVFLPSISGKTKVNGGGVGDYNTDDLNLVCTNARVPGKNVRTIERNMGVSQRVAVGFEPGEATFSFYLSNQFTARKYFQDWMDTVISREGSFDVGFFDDYKADIKVETRDKLDQVVYTTTLQDCFPVTLNEIELNNQAQQAASELTVNIAFKNYVVT